MVTDQSDVINGYVSGFFDLLQYALALGTAWNDGLIIKSLPSVLPMPRYTKEVVRNIGKMSLSVAIQKNGFEY
jgi:hypothetical protein